MASVSAVHSPLRATALAYLASKPARCSTSSAIVAQLTAASSAANGITIITLPTGYRPTASGITFAVGASNVNTTGEAAQMTLGMDGTLHSTNVQAGATVWIGPIQIPLDL